MKDKPTVTVDYEYFSNLESFYENASQEERKRIRGILDDLKNRKA